MGWGLNLLSPLLSSAQSFGIQKPQAQTHLSASFWLDQPQDSQTLTSEFLRGVPNSDGYKVLASDRVATGVGLCSRSPQPHSATAHHQVEETQGVMVPDLIFFFFFCRKKEMWNFQ